MIDDMLKNQVPKKSKGKGLKVCVFFIVFFLILLAVSIGVLYFLKNKKSVSPKDDFINYLGKGNISNVLNFEKINNLSTKFNSEPSESNTELTADIPDIFGDEISLSDMKIAIDSKNDPEFEKKSSDISVKYKDNDVLNFNSLINKNKIGIFSKDILTKYIGSKFSGLSKVITRIANNEGSINTDFNINFEQLLNTNFVFPKLSNEIFSKYINIINQKISETSFSMKNITLERNSEKIDVTEYSMALNEQQAIEFLDQILQTIENDNELLDSLLSSVITNEDQRVELRETFKGEIEKFINLLYEKTPDNSKIYTLKVYGSKDITYKVVLDLAGQANIDIDYEYGENENKMTVTFLENGSQTGVSFEAIRKTSDFSENLNLTINRIEESDIVGKINIVSDLKNSGESYTLKNTFDVNMMFIKVNIQVDSTIDFKSVEVEDLTDDNCLYLDEQDEEVFNSVIEDVRARTEKVVTQNLVDQGVIEPAEEPISTTPSEDSATISSETLKEKSKNKLITSISEAMSIAQSEGREYTLNDLINLEIPDSSFTVSVNDNEAILNIDGFEFKLNSEFQLYE